MDAPGCDSPNTALQHLNPCQCVLSRFAGQGLRSFGDLFQPGSAVAEMGRNLLAQKVPGQIPQFGHGFVMCPPCARHFHDPHRAQVPKIFQALAGRAVAQPQAFHEIAHGQRVRGNEQQAVDFSDGIRSCPSARESCTKRRMTSTSTGFKDAAPGLFSMAFRFISRKYDKFRNLFQ